MRASEGCFAATIDERDASVHMLLHCMRRQGEQFWQNAQDAWAGLVDIFHRAVVGRVGGVASELLFDEFLFSGLSGGAGDEFLGDGGVAGRGGGASDAERASAVGWIDENALGQRFQ